MVNQVESRHYTTLNGDKEKSFEPKILSDEDFGKADFDERFDETDGETGEFSRGEPNDSVYENSAEDFGGDDAVGKNSAMLSRIREWDYKENFITKMIILVLALTCHGLVKLLFRNFKDS